MTSLYDEVPTPTDGVPDASRHDDGERREAHRRRGAAPASGASLRQGMQLTGTHVGCDTTSCGACTVLFDGRPIKVARCSRFKPTAMMWRRWKAWLGQ